MRDRDRPGIVEDYTGAFLTSALALLIMCLTVIWAIWGFAAALFIGWTADRVIVMEARRHRRR